MNPEIQAKLSQLENEINNLRYVVARKTGLGSSDIKGRIQSTVGSAGVLPSDSVTAAMMQSNSISKVKVQDDAVGKNELDFEQAQVVISGASTSGTATVVSGSIPVGYFLSAFTTPAASWVQLAVSGTTLTVTLSTAPGGGNSVTVEVILLKT